MSSQSRRMCRRTVMPVAIMNLRSSLNSMSLLVMLSHVGFFQCPSRSPCWCCLVSAHVRSRCLLEQGRPSQLYGATGRTTLGSAVVSWLRSGAKVVKAWRGSFTISCGSCRGYFLGFHYLRRTFRATVLAHSSVAHPWLQCGSSRPDLGKLAARSLLAVFWWEGVHFPWILQPV